MSTDFSVQNDPRFDVVKADELGQQGAPVNSLVVGDNVVFNTNAGIATTDGANGTTPVVVTNTNVTATSSILLTGQDVFAGSVSVVAKVAGTSFSIASNSVADTALDVAYLIIN